MKKISNFILTLFVLISINVSAQEQEGIAFFKGSFDEGLAKAKAENKKVFLDVYTDWCAPCKKMSKEVFPVKKIGDYYNVNFVSMKVNAEKGEGIDIAKNYQVAGYPSLIFLDADGNVLRQITSYLDSEALYVVGEEAVMGNGNLSDLESGYDNGTISQKDLLAYMIALSGKGLRKKAGEAFEKYFSEEVQNEITPQLLDQINQYALSSDGASFQYLVNNREAFYEKIDRKKVDEMIRFFYQDEFQYRKTFDTEADFFAEKEKLAKNITIDDDLSLELDNGFYYQKQMEDGYIRTAKKLFEKASTAEDHEQISRLTGGGIRFKKEQSLNTLIIWAERALALKESSVNVATLGALYAGLKDKKKATEYFDKAIEVSIRDNDKYDGRIKELKENYLSQID